MPIKSSKRLVPIILAAVLLIIMVTAISTIKSGFLSSKKAVPTIKAQKPLLKKEKIASKATGKNTNNMMLIDSRNMGDFGKKAQTFEEALSKIKAKPKLPDPAVAGDPKGIYVLDAPTPEEQGIGIEYENGVNIWVYPNKHPAFDFEAHVKRHPNKVHYVDIGGFKGTASGPETKTVDMFGEVHDSGAVIWNENGTEYQIYADYLGLGKLLPIARTMRLPTKP